MSKISGCPVCSHPRRAGIDAKLRAEVAVYRVADIFELDPRAISRHKIGCLELPHSGRGRPATISKEGPKTNLAIVVETAVMAKIETARAAIEKESGKLNAPFVTWLRNEPIADLFKEAKKRDFALEWLPPPAREVLIGYECSEAERIEYEIIGQRFARPTRTSRAQSKTMPMPAAQLIRHAILLWLKKHAGPVVPK